MIHKANQEQVVLSGDRHLFKVTRIYHTSEQKMARFENGGI